MRCIFSILLFLLMSGTCAAECFVNFRWDPNQEPDLAGYRLYNTKVSGDYVRVVDNQLVNNLVSEILCRPLDESCACFTQYAIDSGFNCWVVTAFDTEGLESDLSEEACRDIICNKVYNLRLNY